MGDGSFCDAIRKHGFNGPIRQAFWSLLLTMPLLACQIRSGEGAGQVHHQPIARAENLPPSPLLCSSLAAPQMLESHGRKALRVKVKMDVDVDGAPNAYGPAGKKALDVLEHAYAPHAPGQPREIVGFMTDYDGGPPTIQGKNDPYPGYYVSQTDFADLQNPRMEDPRRYVDAERINYVVLGAAARNAGVKLGDFVTAYSCRTGKKAYAIVGDSGNESGAEGSLALVRALGYPAKNGIDSSVDNPEIVLTYFPGTNPQHRFFKSQAALDEAAKKLDLLN